MRFAKVMFALMFVFVTATASVAPRDDDPRHSGPIDRVVKFLRHVLALDDGSQIHVPNP